MSVLWVEVWARPGHASFGRVIEDPPTTDYGFGDGLNERGGGSMRLPDRFDRFNEILFVDRLVPANSISSLVRIYSALDPANPLYEWLPKSLVPTGTKTDNDVAVLGLGIKSILGYARLEAFDWDGLQTFQSRDSDWFYGGRNTITNGSLEDHPWGIANLGFEDGTIEPWWPGANPGVSANAAITTTDVDTGTFAMAVTPLLAEGGASTSLNLYGANFYTVTARVKGAVGVDYQIGASGGNQMVPVAGNSVLFEGTFPGGAEVQHDFVGTGNYETVTLIFGTAGDQTTSMLSIRERGAVLDGSTFFVDDVTISGFGIGTAPWEPTGVQTPEVVGPVPVFEVSNVQASQGSWSLFVTADPNHGAFQRIAGVLPGVTYTATVDVGFADVASTWLFEVRDVQGNVLGSDNAVIGTGAFSPIEVVFTAPDFLSGPRGEVHLRVINGDSAQRTAYIDNLVFFRGQPAASIGKILGDLYDDATTDHTGRVVWEDEANPGTPYLTLDFTDTVDSDGNPWVPATLEVKLWMRMDYLQVMEQFARAWGYEYRIVPDNPETGSWLWQVYNPGGMGVDRTADPGPAIQGGSYDIRRSVRRWMPEGTEMMVEGDLQGTGRAADAGLVQALGRIESSRLDRELPALDAVQEAADEDAGFALSEGVTYSYTQANPPDEPITTFQIGDLLTIHDPPEVNDVARFTDVTVTVTPERTVWDATFTPPTVDVT